MQNTCSTCGTLDSISSHVYFPSHEIPLSGLTQSVNEEMACAATAAIVREEGEKYELDED